jgi:hypothetical protein
MERPICTTREKIKADIDKTKVAKAVAHLIATMLHSIKAEEADYWINASVNVRVQNGTPIEKKAVINVYAETLDVYGTNIIDPPSDSEILSDFFKNFGRNQ